MPSSYSTDLLLLGLGMMLAFCLLVGGLVAALAWRSSEPARRRRTARLIRRSVRRTLQARAILGPDVELPYPG